MASVISALEAHEAYVERIKAEFHGPRYNWLLEMLSRSTYAGLPVEDSCLYVLDFDGNAAPKEVLHAPASGDLPDGLLHSLEPNLSPSVTRVVLLYYSYLSRLNFKYLGAIGYTLDLDPRVFSTHFQDSNRGRLNEDLRPPSRLHLDTTILKFYFREDRRITACTVQNTVVILYEYRSGDIATIAEPLLTRSSCLQRDEAISNLNLPAIDLVAMILEVETLNLVTAIDIEDDAIREERSLKETALRKKLVVGHGQAEHWESYWSERVRIEATVRNLSAALASKQWSNGHAPLAKRLLQEFYTILNRSKSQGEYIREGVQQIHTKASMEETRKGIQQSDSVRRLTLVAFVFIPLNFATSFFGMNVRQFGTGSINIGYFFLAAAMIGGFAALLSFVVKPLERQVQRRREKIADDLEEDVEIIQKREILRQSTLGKRLWERKDDVELDWLARYKLERPGPKIRKAIKLSANTHWKKLTTRHRDGTKGQQADPEQQREGDFDRTSTEGLCHECRRLHQSSQISDDRAQN